MRYTKPPYQLNSTIFDTSLKLQQILGELNTFELVKPSIQLRKENKIKTIHHSLAIEGNSFSIEHITAILENKKVIGSKKEIIEVTNALQVYEDLSKFNPLKEIDLKKAHKTLTSNLVTEAGRYRKGNVGILKGSKVGHMAPQPKLVPKLMGDLFAYLADPREKSFLIKACVFHYELEFVHPFEDGNGRMGRLWQQLLLMQHSAVFQFIPVETLIHQNQKKYYQVLEKCDKAGDSTLFIQFSLELILRALAEFQKSYKPNRIVGKDRILIAMSKLNEDFFSRSEYLALFPGLSTATASRDLAAAVQANQLKITGEKSQAKYQILAGGMAVGRK